MLYRSKHGTIHNGAFEEINGSCVRFRVGDVADYRGRRFFDIARNLFRNIAMTGTPNDACVRVNAE